MPTVLRIGPYDLREVERLIFDNHTILKQAYYDRHTR